MYEAFVGGFLIFVAIVTVASVIHDVWVSDQ